MGTKHTAGPWRIDGCEIRNPSGPNDLLISHGNGDTFSPLIAQVHQDEGRLPARANAHLIAAAPDMLAALQELVSSYPTNAGMVQGNAGQIAALDAAIAAIRAAEEEAN